MPFERLAVLDREWREWCANWGAPVNAFAAAVETFKASRLLDAGVPSAAARAAPSSSSSSSSSAASKRRRDDKKDDAAGGVGGGRGKRTMEEQVCFNWNAGRVCIATPCPRRHVCRHCGGAHAGKDCGSSGGSGVAGGTSEKRRRGETGASSASAAASSSSATASAPPGGKH